MLGGGLSEPLDLLLREGSVCVSGGRLAGGDLPSFGGKLAERGSVWPPDEFVGIIGGFLQVLLKPRRTPL